MSNTWIFQSVVDRYDLRDEKIFKVGKKDTWYATRYQSKMQKGDVVYFWLGGLGDDRGIYGVGHLDSSAYQKEDWDSSGVDVVYDRKLHSPVKVSAIKRHGILKNLLILRSAQATNFLLEPEQAVAIADLIDNQG